MSWKIPRENNMLDTQERKSQFRYVSKPKNILQNMFLLFLSVAVFVVGLEIALRVLVARAERTQLKQQETLRRESEFVFYEFDRYLGWKNKPLAEGSFATPDSKTFVRINSKGLRDQEYEYAKPAGVYRILVLGDSFAWGYGVEQGKNFTDRLEELLNKSVAGNLVEVINAGVSGYGSDQELLLLEREGMKYQPDLVLVAFATNDFTLDNKSGRHGYYLKPYFSVEGGQLKVMNYPLADVTAGEWEDLLKNWKPEEKAENRKGFKGFLKYQTKTYPFLSQGLKDMRYSILRSLSRNPAFGRVFNQTRIDLSKEDIDLKVTKKIFMKMKEIASSGNAQLAVFVVPYKSALEKLPNPHIQDFLDFFQSNEIACFYPYDIFYKKFKSGEKLFLNHDDHWNENGHMLAAEALRDFLVEQGLIPVS